MEEIEIYRKVTKVAEVAEDGAEKSFFDSGAGMLPAGLWSDSVVID